ncbi:unnamed protein product [Gadus morhua 'NCC']
MSRPQAYSLSGEPSRVGGGGLEERFRGKWADSRIDQPGTLGEEQETPGDGPGRSRRPQGTAREGAGDPRGRPGKEQETPGDGPGRSRGPKGTAREGAGDPRGRPGKEQERGRPGKEQETPGDDPGRSRRPQGTARALDARQTSRHAEPLWRTTRGLGGETVVSPITLRDINPFYT